MIIRNIASGIVTALLVGACATGPIAEITPPLEKKIAWPNGAKTAIALTYDDSLATHLDVAIPALDEAGLKGTFYMVLNRYHWESRRDEWKAIAQNGHELGNKSIHHPCQASKDERDWVDPANDLDKYTIAQMETELYKANTEMTAVDGKETRTFAFPCGESKTSDGSYAQAIKPLFVGARSVYDVPFRNDDRYNIVGIGTENASAEQLIARIQTHVQTGHAAALVMFGVGGDYMSVSKEVHQQVIDYLVENQDDIWVDTIENIATYLAEIE